MPAGIDHVLIAVPRLADAITAYRQLGFTVAPGGQHANGATHNALVAFADGAYLELIALIDPDQPPQDQWGARLVGARGLIGYALGTANADADAQAAAGRGLTVRGPADNSRLRPDGERVAWRAFTIDAGEAGNRLLPFVIEDVTPRDVRVPSGEAAIHPLDVTRLAGAEVAVPDLEAASALYAALLGSQPEATGTGRRFQVGHHWIELRSAAAGETPGLVAIELAGPNVDAGTWLPLEPAFGAKIRLAHA